MKFFSLSGIRVALQDVFLSDTPLSLRPEKTPLQWETPQPDLSDRLRVKPTVFSRDNFVMK